MANVCDREMSVFVVSRLPPVVRQTLVALLVQQVWGLKDPQQFYPL